MMRGMLEPLDPAEWRVTQACFAPLAHHLAVRALLDGAVPGVVYADDAPRPRLAVAHVQQRLYVAGDANIAGIGRALRGLIASRIGPLVMARGIRYMLLHAAPALWEQVIETGLQDFAPRTTERQTYACRLPRPERPPRMPADYTLRAVDQALLGAAPLAHRDQLLDEMRSERPSVEAFLAKSFGVCAVQGEALAGWCLSEYNHLGACEVGIETLPEHRGRGLATAMTLALVQQAAAQGLTRVGWHCYAHNQASVATALAAGFALVGEERACVLDLQGRAA